MGRPLTLLAATLAVGMIMGTQMLYAESTDIIDVTIDTDRKYQVIEGFGASGAWWPTWVCEYPREDQLRMLRLLFTDEGAGLNIYRYNIPAGSGGTVNDPTRRTPDIETSPGQYNFEADAIGIGFLRDVRAMGVEHFVLFANSPPGRMTLNGQTSGGDEGASNFDPAATQDFAVYLVDIAQHLQKDLGLPHVTLSPINEPQWKWGKDRRHQEGCHYTPEEVARTIRAVVDEVKRRGLDMRVEAPESGAWKDSKAYAEQLFNDDVLDETLDTFAVHSYWSNEGQKRAFTTWFNRRYPGKKLSMTEYCQMKPIHDLGIDAGLHLAGVIHDDMTIGSVVTWQWWLSIAAGGYADGLIYAYPDKKQIEVTKRLWAMAHYARFVRPGSRRVGATPDDAAVRVSAYISPGGDSVTAVMINPAEAGKEVRLEIPRHNLVKPAHVWVTSDDADLAQRPVENGIIVLPAKSIVTVVAGIQAE